MDRVEDEEMESDAEREPLRFDLDLSTLDPKLGEVMIKIKELAEDVLYHWSVFPFHLPPTITDSGPSGGESDPQGTISFGDLFMAPNFDELEEVAMDSNGQPKLLTNKQLEDVRHMGEFEVDSNHFVGQVHRWRLSLLLQKGTRRAHNTLLDDLALALRIVIITGRNRLYSHFFSISQGIKGLCRGLWHIVDLMIGVPFTTPGDINRKVQEEHMRYLVAELDTRAICKAEWNTFCDYVKETKQREGDRMKTTELQPPLVPYRYQTPKGIELDLRLFNKDLLDKCTVIVKRILEKEAKGWYIKYKDKLLTELKDRNLTHHEIVTACLQHKTFTNFPEVNKAIREEYLRRVFDSIQENDSLEELQPGIGKLLVEQVKAVLLMTQAIERTRQKLQTHRDQLKDHLMKSYPVRSRIQAWLNEKLHMFQEDFSKQNQWVAHEEAIELCRNDHLDQAVYFLQRDLIFMRDREPVLRKELGKVKIPVRVYPWSVRIWFPGRWIIKRIQNGETEVIPTIIVDAPAAAPLRSRPEADEDFSSYFPIRNIFAARIRRMGKPTFIVEKHVKHTTSTRYPFWRWINYFYRTFSWTVNSMFWLGIAIPWCSKVGIRALLYKEPFKPDLKLSKVNGTLCPDERSITPTLRSRLQGLWEHVRYSRAKFEEEPDTGFLGKAFTRHINRFWNYVMKGGVGSFLLVTVFPLICILVCTLCLLAAITAPVWMPLVTLCVHLFFILIYDFDHPIKGWYRVLHVCEAVIWQMGILGILQILCAFITAVILCPLASAVILIVGFLKRGGRAVWDTFMFHAVIKKRGRVPAQDGFIARRIAGPGLASNYFYQIKPEQALAAIEAQMELHEINSWSERIGKKIDLPLREFEQFVKTCFGPFSARLSVDGVYLNLQKETDHLHMILRDEVDRRKSQLATGLTQTLRKKIKLTRRELKVTVTQAARLLEDFYPEHVISRLSKSEQEFWEDRHLEVNDWQGLATQLLCEVFSSSFLSPLEDTDTCFKLEVEHLNLRRYLEMLKSSEFRDDLDVVSAVPSPKGDIDVEAPHLDISLFNPMNYSLHWIPKFKICGGYKLKPWKTTRWVDAEKLEAAMPIPHPVLVSVLIYNRENDQDPIDLEDVFCKWKLEAALSTPYVDTADISAAEVYETGDVEVSTPGTTTNSDQEVTVSHLAEAEHAFSEASMNMTTPDSLQSPADEELPDFGNAEDSSVDDLDVPPTEETALKAKDGHTDVDIVIVPAQYVVIEPAEGGVTAGASTSGQNKKNGKEDEKEELVGSVVYIEPEADTSCVLHVDEADNSSNCSGVYDNVHHMC